MVSRYHSLCFRFSPKNGMLVMGNCPMMCCISFWCNALHTPKGLLSFANIFAIILVGPIPMDIGMAVC